MIAEQLANVCSNYGVNYIFKASFDKANRSSYSSFRGIGLQEGLSILSEIRSEFSVPVLTDIHESSQAPIVGHTVDVIQIPAYLCRQTDLLAAAARTSLSSGAIVNIKKGQFLSPNEMGNVVDKMISFGMTKESGKLWVTERGTSFGYNNLIVDYRSLPQLRSLGCPVLFDATHSIQQPGGLGNRSAGQREFVAPLARAAVAVGVDGIFMEVHPNPDVALSDGPNMLPLHRFESLLVQLLDISSAMSNGFAVSTI
jgi:2-dehydro-3-deoxyphosphooctonate aldolase (KDO 8-P synthase)